MSSTENNELKRQDGDVRKKKKKEMQKSMERKSEDLKDATHCPGFAHFYQLSVLL